MKYIDADKLIAEIEKFSSTEYSDNTFGDEVANGALYYVIEKIIPSLQQDKDVLDLCSRVWWEDRGWMMIPPNVTLKGIESLLMQLRKKLQAESSDFDDVDPKHLVHTHQEQPEVDLEKELDQWRHKHFKGKRDDDYSGEYLERESQLDLARHFYELGLNARK